MEYERNNLDKATSPYLKQHADNPVWWQEWGREVLEHARNSDKILFVSVGYATCHWCHVMAGEAFSEKNTADFLNRHFISIKVDREQRPDIDRYLMDVSVAATGSGGWPLNAFLTPELKPITALTYAPASPRMGMPSFLEILENVKEVYDKKGDRISEFRLTEASPGDRASNVVMEGLLVDRLSSGFDRVYGGIGEGAKFPPHSQLMLLLYYQGEGKDGTAKDILETTLDNMFLMGLHDHLQGGFFRYCVDRKWNIPHFEKMLYDQAYLLWIYSMAWKTLGRESYLRCAERIVRCLGETFAEDGLFVSGHDADTDHREGDTYLWSEKELRKVLTGNEFRRFSELYDISEQGNFEGKNHLLRKKEAFPGDMEEKLLSIRKKREQPFVDRKKITSLNCAAGIALIHAHRYTGGKGLLAKAVDIYSALKERNSGGGKFFHSSIDGSRQKEEFLEDRAWVLLLLTYLHEETGKYEDEIKESFDKLKAFKAPEGRWMQATDTDFIPVPADPLDHSSPSPVSAAELALVRAGFYLGVEQRPRDLMDPLITSFMDIALLASNGSFHIIHSPEKLPWDRLPLNAIQVSDPSRGVCYKGVCREGIPEEWKK